MNNEEYQKIIDENIRLKNELYFANDLLKRVITNKTNLMAMIVSDN